VPSYPETEGRHLRQKVEDAVPTTLVVPKRMIFLVLSRGRIHLPDAGYRRDNTDKGLEKPK